MKKILCVIYSLSGGGAERQMQYLLSRINTDACDVHLAVCRKKGHEYGYIPQDIHIHAIGTFLRPSSLFILFKLVRIIRSFKPDYILSFLWSMNIISVLAGIMTGVRVVISERIVTSLSMREYSFVGLRKMLITILYRKAFAVVANSRDVQQDLVTHFKVPEHTVQVIYNGVDRDMLYQKSEEYKPPISGYVLACGSLTKKKNHILLVRAMSRIPGITMVIIGEGPEKDVLQDAVREEHIHGMFPGFLHNPFPWIKHAGAVVLTSRYEGFPNIILEAMILGTPVVSVECPGGIHELIRNEKTGIISDADPEHLAAAVSRILDNKELSARLVIAARSHAETYDVMSMVRHYEKIFI